MAASTWNPCEIFSNPDAVAGLGVLALRVGESAEREARNSGARHRRERQAADVIALQRMARWRDGISTVTVEVT